MPEAQATRPLGHTAKKGDFKEEVFGALEAAVAAHEVCGLRRSTPSGTGKQLIITGSAGRVNGRQPSALPRDGGSGRSVIGVSRRGTNLRGLQRVHGYRPAGQVPRRRTRIA